MTVNELSEKLEKLKMDGFGDSEVMLGSYIVDGLFVPTNEIRSCYGLQQGEHKICGLATSFG